MTNFEQLPKPFRSVTDVGFSEDINERYRTTMEDSHCIIDGYRGNLNDALFAIYDGHSGKSTVDIVEQLFPLKLANALDELGTEKVQEAISRAFRETDLETTCTTGGSTCVSSLILTDPNDLTKRVLYTANCGDSRAVISEDGIAHALSHDHKGTDPEEMNRVINSGGKIKRGRVNTQLAVTRAFGNHQWKRYVISEPYQTRIQLTSRHSILILACDGLWDVIGNQEAVDLCEQILQVNQGCAQDCSKRLLDKAKQKGSTDNLSVIVVIL